MVAKKNTKKEEVFKSGFEAFEQFEGLDDESLGFVEPEYVEKAEVKHQGIELDIDNKIYVAPSLTIGQYKRLFNQIANIDSLEMEAKVNLILYVFYLSLSRNYKNVNKDWIEYNVDFITLSKVYTYIVSGKKDEEIEEEKKS